MRREGINSIITMVTNMEVTKMTTIIDPLTNLAMATVRPSLSLGTWSCCVLLEESSTLSTGPVSQEVHRLQLDIPLTRTTSGVTVSPHPRGSARTICQGEPHAQDLLSMVAIQTTGSLVTREVASGQVLPLVASLDTCLVTVATITMVAEHTHPTQDPPSGASHTHIAPQRSREDPHFHLLVEVVAPEAQVLEQPQGLVEPNGDSFVWTLASKIRELIGNISD